MIDSIDTNYITQMSCATHEGDEQIEQTLHPKKLAKFSDGKLSSHPGEILNIDLVNTTNENLPKKKLLILDLNHVLVGRVPRTSIFHTRPFVIEFLLEMAKHYRLAIWTSMKNKTGRKICKKIFEDQSQDINTLFLFIWYQSKCTPLPDTIDIRDGLPTLSKNLSRVWAIYPQYNEFNTILLDDSPLKCSCNPSYTIIHPYPYEMNQQATDTEMQSGQPLWNYLVELASITDPIQIMAYPSYHSPLLLNTAPELLNNNVDNNYGNNSGDDSNNK